MSTSAYEYILTHYQTASQKEVPSYMRLPILETGYPDISAREELGMSKRREQSSMKQRGRRKLELCGYELA